MEKISILGELLYIGFNAEKGRCKSQGFWRFGYKRMLKNHISFTKKIINRMCVKDVDEGDTQLLRDFLKMCKNFDGIGKYYNISASAESILTSCNALILTSIDKERCNDVVNKLMLEMTEDLLTALNSKPLNRAYPKTHYTLKNPLNNTVFPTIMIN